MCENEAKTGHFNKKCFFSYSAVSQNELLRRANGPNLSL